LVVFGLCLAGCGEADPNDLPQVALIDDFASKSDVSSARSKLRDTSDWKVVTSYDFTPDGMSRRVEKYVVELSNYESLGSSGTLYLTFFDDLLALTLFCPTAFGEYLERLERDLGVEISSRGYKGRGRVIWTMPIQGGVQCVAWRDDRLTRLFRESS